MRKGIAVSPGVAVGTAYCIHEIFVDPDKKRLEEQEITAELARYETARDQAGTDLRALRVKVEAQVGQEEAAIFRVHETILRHGLCGAPSTAASVLDFVCADEGRVSEGACE